VAAAEARPRLPLHALQISIKAKYSVWVTLAEHATMAQRLKRC
jgi:hypothetical protein